MWRRYVLLVFIALLFGGWRHGVGAVGGTSWNRGTSQGQAHYLDLALDAPFINLLKMGVSWTYGDSSGSAGPAELDINGYPLSGANAFSHGGVYTTTYGPSQFERPGHYVVLWGGAGTVQVFQLAVGSGTIANVSCQYSSNGGALQNGTYSSGSCSNTACTGVCTGRWEFSVSGENTNNFVHWELRITAVNAGNIIQNIALVHVSDEAAFGWSMVNWTAGSASHDPKVGNSGQIFSPLFLSRVAAGGFGVWRFLDWTDAANSASNCQRWSERKSTAYAFYAGKDMRNALYAGVNGYALNGSSNDYTGTLGSGPPTNKQTVINYYTTTATNGTITYNLNGTGALPVYDIFGVPIPNSNTFYFPTANTYGILIFDSELNPPNGAWISFSGGSFSSTGGLNCGAPPEVALAFAITARVHPWFDAYYHSLIPLQDYMPSLAAYLKANAPSWMIPRFTAGNEPFNNQGYASTKANIYWGTTNDFLDWFSMGASVMCQAIFNVYGAKDGSKYECMVEPQVSSGDTPDTGNALITSPQYVAHGPAQAGYAQDPAYKWLTAFAINNYWTPVENSGSNAVQIGNGIVQDGWCYVNQGTGCAASATILQNFVATALNPGQFGINRYNNWFINFAKWIKGNSDQCSGNATNCNILNMYSYEGGYAANFFSADLSNTVSSATNAASAVLTTSANNGCYPGQTVALTSVVGGTWSASYTGLTVSAATATTCTVNINSTSLGTLTSATLTYTGSQTYINQMLQDSYAAPEVGTLTLTQYANFIAAGGKWPSMYVLCDPAHTNTSWNVWAPDIYGATSSATDPGTPQWQAIQQFNGTGTCASCSAPAAPTVTSLSATFGAPAGSTATTITGTNLSGATAVKFGSTNAASFTVNSSTSITATSPAGTIGTIVDVTVTTPGGTSATGAGDKFTYANCSQVATLFGRMDGGQNSSAVDGLICGLVTDSTYSLFDALWVFATNSTANANLNWIQNSFNLTQVGTVTFAANAGYTSNGSTGYFTTGYNPSTAGGQFTLNSASFGLCDLTSRASANGNLLGFAVATPGISIELYNGSALGIFSLNDASFANGTISNAQASWIVSRTASSGWVAYKNGTSSITAGSATSTSIPNLPWFLLTYNSAGSPGTPITDQVGYAFAASGLNATQVTNIYNRLHTYMAAVGAGAC